MQNIWFNFLLAIEAVLDNKVRALLTALGIVFGVAAVIAMLAIGAGAQQSILDQMKLIGTNNIEINAVVPEGSTKSAGASAAGQSNKRDYSTGLTLEDVKSIQQLLPEVEKTSPEIIMETQVIRGRRLERSRCIGIENAFFELNAIDLEHGQYFTPIHLERGAPVCIIGKNIEAKFFSDQNPLGKKIKCGQTWLTVIGVLARRGGSSERFQELGIRNFNDDIYIPTTTALRRFRDRNTVSAELLSLPDDEKLPEKYTNYHQLDRLVIHVREAKQLTLITDFVARLLKRRHQGVIDFEIRVPELLLKQQQKTQDTFNYVLGAIAGISLLVGGIGIMNIMLASVLERIKEIGVRRSLGATRQDIIWQFLFESVFISLVGGLIGIVLGVVLASLIAQAAEIPTLVSNWSIVLSFGVAASVGLLFGLVPARRAALQDPIKALRRD